MMHNKIESVFPSIKELPILLTQVLSGVAGSNREREDRCQIQASNDYEALQCWLNEYRETETTFRTYQKEGERFLLWSVLQRKKALSSLDRDDLEAYLDFLEDPRPYDTWCSKKGGRGCKRGEKGWRPFKGPLSQNAKRTAVSAIDSLLNYLVDARYLAFNPLKLMRKRKIKRHTIHRDDFSLQERTLAPDEWDALLNTLENYPETTSKERDEKARTKFIVYILYFLGLRINELATHDWKAFHKIENDWWFYVIGKGGKLGRVPVNDELLKAIIIYRTYLKKPMYPTSQDESPIIVSFKRGKPLTPRHINKVLKKLALKTSKKFKNDPGKIAKLRKFSAHWLRHLSASMQDRAGIQFKHIRANHRHENDETTRRYVHAIDRERHEDMQKLKLRAL
jgi:site-specific recombinase XerD